MPTPYDEASVPAFDTGKLDRSSPWNLDETDDEVDEVPDDDIDRLEISIVSNKEDGVPVSTVMKHRNKEKGHWEYDADMDSGEQGSARGLPGRVQQLLKSFGHQMSHLPG